MLPALSDSEKGVWTSCQMQNKGFGHSEDIPVTGPVQYIFRMSETFVQADNRQDRLAQWLAGGEQAADRQDMQTRDKTDGQTKQNGQRKQGREKACRQDTRQTDRQNRTDREDRTETRPADRRQDRQTDKMTPI